MDHIQMKSDLIEQLIKISKEAGKAILEVYNTHFDYQIKEDLSPLTIADTLSDNIIRERLKILTPDIPVLSEENSNIPFSIRSLWKQYWLVDPLDGTKEFIKRNGEFTVNIALISKNKPILGVIHVPDQNKTYWGSIDEGSFCQQKHSTKKLEVSKEKRDVVKLVISRSHPSAELSCLLSNIDNCEIIQIGSSLKFCLIAEGNADIYPRLGPTSEWDTAAGEAIVKYAGGITLTNQGYPMTYNLKESYINPNFIVSRDTALAKHIVSFF